jgi:hypothetical protein
VPSRRDHHHRRRRPDRVQVLLLYAPVPLTATLGVRTVCFGGRVLLAHCLSTCRPSVPVNSTVNCYVAFINNDAHPRSWRKFLLSSSCCSSRLGPLVRKRKDTPRNSSNQVIIKEETVQIENESQYKDMTTNKPFI